jgi:hypothetical protein
MLAVAVSRGPTLVSSRLERIDRGTHDSIDVGIGEHAQIPADSMSSL